MPSQDAATIIIDNLAQRSRLCELIMFKVPVDGLGELEETIGEIIDFCQPQKPVKPSIIYSWDESVKDSDNT